MELFIRIENGMPYEHPIILENFRQAFPNVDIENLPPQFARFDRVPAPEIGVYEVNEGVSYEWVDGRVRDLWHVRAMTPVERQAYIDQQLANPPYASWNFNEELGFWEPPVPRPETGAWYWNETEGQWMPIPLDGHPQ